MNSARDLNVETSSLPQDLRSLVRETVELLGRVLERELGPRGYARVEQIRAEMVELRHLDRDAAYPVLKKRLDDMRGLSKEERLDLARSFTLMLEVMNACENAYRSHRISERAPLLTETRPDSIIYVLTAHPTEARSPANIEIFHSILLTLIPVFQRPGAKLSERERESLSHSLELAWRASLVRERKPRVVDEADHIFSTALRDETLTTILQASEDFAPIYLRSWVGGDKDGHPGVDETTFLQSLAQSRSRLLEFCRSRLGQVLEDLERIGAHELAKEFKALLKSMSDLKEVSTGDAGRIVRLKKSARKASTRYEAELGFLHPKLRELKKLLHLFPALVVPLEFRESSDVLLSRPRGAGLAIVRMLKTLKKLSGPHDPRWYVRGFIVSMTSELGHLEAAADLVEAIFGQLRLPVIPLFEQSGALSKSESIVGEMIRSPRFAKAIRTDWDGRLEMMLGYSDSSKESGVLRSRVQVAETMHRLDHLCRRSKLTPIFFQGSGGSTDRGGGSIEEQLSWWPSGALRNYKVTVQGEMVERSLASREITRGQLEKIAKLAGAWREAENRKIETNPALDEFADRVAAYYQKTVHADDFLEMIGAATPYKSLDLLRIGSRPTKRTTQISVEGLRAIPWVLCWTQTRTLFPTWWGVGRAWMESTPLRKDAVREAYRKSAVVSSYVKALGYTLAKVRLSVFRCYLDESALPQDLKKKIWTDFCDEFDRSLAFVREITNSNDLIKWRPWLGDSITLRSPMIHPLNLLQILAMKDKDDALLRVTVTGISAGMMATG